MRNVEKCPWCSDDPKASQFHQLCQRDAAIYAVKVRRFGKNSVVAEFDELYRKVPDANLTIRMSELEESCEKLEVGISKARKLFERNQEFLVGREADKWYRDVSRWLEGNWPMHHAHFILKKAMLKKAIQEHFACKRSNSSKLSKNIKLSYKDPHLTQNIVNYNK